MRAYIINDWNGVRMPQKTRMTPLPEPSGLSRGDDGQYRCPGEEEPIQRMVIKDPTAYDAAAAVEVAYVCPEHGSYWYAYEKSGNPLHAVYGPFRMER